MANQISHFLNNISIDNINYGNYILFDLEEKNLTRFNK